MAATVAWDEINAQPMSPKAPVTFLSLSAELRNKINLYAILDHEGLEEHANTQVNRQLRNETLAMFYASAPFHADLTTTRGYKY